MPSVSSVYQLTIHWYIFVYYGDIENMVHIHNGFHELKEHLLVWWTSFNQPFPFERNRVHFVHVFPNSRLESRRLEYTILVVYSKRLGLELHRYPLCIEVRVRFNKTRFTKLFTVPKWGLKKNAGYFVTKFLLVLCSTVKKLYVHFEQTPKNIMNNGS